MEAHRGRPGQGAHTTTDGTERQNSFVSDEECGACGNDSLRHVRTLRGRAQFACVECGATNELPADRVDVAEGSA